MRREWNYDLLIPLFKASGLENLEYFKEIIRSLEKVVA